MTDLQGQTKSGEGSPEFGNWSPHHGWGEGGGVLRPYGWDRRQDKSSGNGTRCTFDWSNGGRCGHAGDADCKHSQLLGLRWFVGNQYNYPIFLVLCLKCSPCSCFRFFSRRPKSTRTPTSRRLPTYKVSPTRKTKVPSLLGDYCFRNKHVPIARWVFGSALHLLTVLTTVCVH